ncbi:SDR family oxidoreductase [Candidatus Entotheonella palauensis]|uniref:SDR family oxidoreductase n=1 Tax=Candidatus Entotheonella palauensis TaxID=93172 RepID=UPI000B7D2ED3|nr:sugar nucleotide-binding protein [Candidatus Entotheonella palauensis]
MKRVLITGVTSLHGWPLYKALTRQLGPQSVLGICPPKTKTAQFPEGNALPCCINDVTGLTAAFEQFRPTHVIHAAGMCDLDVCELWPSLAYQRNVEGTDNIARLSRDCHLMHISTDLVFSGNDPPPNGYDEDSPPDPPSMIGKTFIEAEAIVAQLPHAMIVRKGLPMGDSLSGRKGPIDYLAYRFRRGKPLTLFYDELRSALYIDDLILGLRLLWETEATGHYHFGGPNASVCTTLATISLRPATTIPLVSSGPHALKITTTCRALATSR